MVDVTAGQGGASPSTGFPSLSEIRSILKRGDLALAFGILTILVVLILPLPSIVLDLFLAISITLSILILMTSLFIQAPLEFSSFPTILLISTMLRLSLNLASTRLILSHGHEGTDAAGHVIEAFGGFVMGGNFVIGIIVFAILVIVNFVVITKGSGRIAEVAARFHLDAMPGKQMAIDADLSAGLIDEKVAKERRKALEDESGFFGAMDGASKFVRGDAVAGLLVVFINVIGGIIIGVAQQGLSFSEAAHTYTLLTVGDGLVTQIPALIVSTAAGLLVSKAGVTGAADKALMKQLSGYPQALGMSAGVMLVLAMLPGIPMIPFLALSGGAAALAMSARKFKRETAAAAASAAAASPAAATGAAAEEPISTALKIDDLLLALRSRRSRRSRRGQPGRRSPARARAAGPAAAAPGRPPPPGRRPGQSRPGPDGRRASWVIAENNRLGTTAWKILHPKGRIAGFANRTYARQGQRVTLYVSTGAAAFRAEAFRMGYYQGTGARLIWTSAEIAGKRQARCPVTPGVNMVACDNWRPSVAFTVSAAFVPGDYLIKFSGPRRPAELRAADGLGFRPAGPPTWCRTTCSPGRRGTRGAATTTTRAAAPARPVSTRCAPGPGWCPSTGRTGPRTGRGTS